MAFSLFRSVQQMIAIAALCSFAFPQANAQNYSGSNTSPENRYYLQCAANIASVDNDPGYKNELGLIGIFQFDVYKAQKAGLCKDPVPLMSGKQLWKLCDFKGPIAVKYKLRNQYDLRFDGQAAAAQFEMMQNLNAYYDNIIYKNQYDRLFNKYISAIPFTPPVQRSLLHSFGLHAVNAFLKGNPATNRYNSSLFSMAGCIKQCLDNKGTTWLCN